MNIVSWSTFRKMTTDKVAELLPLTIVANGEPFIVLDRPTNIMVLGDLHIRVRNMLRAMETRARAGMPKPVRADYLPEFNEKPVEDEEPNKES